MENFQQVLDQSTDTGKFSSLDQFSAESYRQRSNKESRDIESKETKLADGLLPKVDLVDKMDEAKESQSGDNKQVKYESNLDEAAEKAKKEGKLLVMVFSDSDSSKRMDERRKDCKEFQDLADKAVFARIDLDKLSDSERQSIMDKYHIIGSPTTLVVDPATGQEKLRNLGNSYFPDVDASVISSIISGKGNWTKDHADLSISVQEAIQKNQVDDETIAKAEQATKLSGDFLGPDHIYTLSSEKLLAKALVTRGQEGDLEKAQEILSSVEKRCSDNFANPQRPADQKKCDASLLLECSWNLGNLKLKSGDKEAALASFKKAIEALDYMNNPRLLPLRNRIMSQIHSLEP